MANNILEYVLSLRDQMSGSMKKIGVNSDVALEKFAALEKQSEQVKRAFAGLGTNVTTLNKRINLLRAERDLIPAKNISAIRKYNDEIRKLNGQVERLQNLSGNNSVQRWFTELWGAIPGGQLLSNPLLYAGAGIGKAIKLGVEEDRQRVSFEVLLGGQAAAKNLMDDIARYAKNTPYQKLGLGDAAKTMLGFGVEAEKIMPQLKNIGDIAMGDANRMSSLTLAFAQMSSTGRLTGQDLLQMINAGFNPLDEISQKTGKSIGVLKDEMAKGAISSQMVEDAFTAAAAEGGKFHNMANKIGQTLGGRFSTLMESINEKFLKLYAVISPVALLIVESLIKGIDRASAIFGFFFQKLREGNPWVVGITAVIGAFTAALILHNTYTAVATFWTNKLTFAILKQNLAFLGNPITWIIAGVIALIAVIAYLIYKIDGWSAAWKHTVNSGKLLWELFTEGIKHNFNSMIDTVMLGVEKILLAWHEFKEATSMGSSAENQAMIADLRQGIKDREAAIKSGDKKLKELANAAAAEQLLAFGSLQWNDKSLTDIKNSLLSQLGIAAPGGTPGAAGTRIDGKGAGGAGNLETATGIATGGTKHNYITINLKDLIGVLNLYTKDSKDSAKQLQDNTTDALMRVLAMATTAGN